MFEKALSFGGWPGLILLLFGISIGCIWWLFLIVNGKYKKSFFLLITIFPFTFYAGRAFGILAYFSESAQAQFDQRIGLTTFMLLFTAVALYNKSMLHRPVFAAGKKIEYLLWGYAISITVSQLFNHIFVSAILLSIGAAWQYLILYYLLISLIKNDRDLLGLLNSIFFFSLINIVVRVVCKGESLIIDVASQGAGETSTFGAEVGRVGSGALGLGASYAVYLVIFITLALGILYITNKKRYLLYIAIIFIELLNTFSRGGIFTLMLVAMLLFFSETRKYARKLIGYSFILTIVFFQYIWEYISLRGFHLNVLQERNFTDRIELILKFAYEYYQVSLFGNGIFKNTLIELYPWFSTVIHNTYLEILDVCGIFPFIIFVMITIYSFYILWNIEMDEGGHAERLIDCRMLRPFFIVAFIQWVVFANTTSNSILAYFPYEGNCIFWIVFFSGFLLMNITSQRQENMRLVTS